jgi:hypothetical protein
MRYILTSAKVFSLYSNYWSNCQNIGRVCPKRADSCLYVYTAILLENFSTDGFFERKKEKNVKKLKKIQSEIGFEEKRR